MCSDIILHMRKVLFGHLLSIETFNCANPMILFADSEVPDQIWAFAVRACPEGTFSLGAAHIKFNLSLQFPVSLDFSGLSS